MRKAGLGLLLAAVAIGQFGFVPKTQVAQAADNGIAQKPYMGWSTYSLQVYDGPAGNWTSAEKIKQQSDAMRDKLQAHGYEYINIDAGWNGGMDEYGRPIPSTTLYPNGFQEVIDYVHNNGQKIGIYMIPGLTKQAYEADLPIYNAPGCSMRDIAAQPLRTADYWNIGYKMDFTSSEHGKECAQAYIDSLAELIASWGIDFLKFDSVTPGSGHNNTSIDARDDVAAWSKALAKQEHKIWFELSWALDHNYIDFWREHANGWRVNWDVESYDPKVGLTQWANIARLFPDAALWWRDARPGGWNDFDSLNVGNGAMDGLTKDERQTAMTLWSMSAAPLYIGNDMTNLDEFGLSLLTNDEVIAVNQAGRPAHPVSMETNHQVWYANNGDGTYTVALFNHGTKGATVTANWRDIGLTGAASVRDLWSHSELGTFETGYSAVNLEPHASRLFKVTAKNGTSSVNDDDTGMNYVGSWARNGGREQAAGAQELELQIRDSGAEQQPAAGTSASSEIETEAASSSEGDSGTAAEALGDAAPNAGLRDASGETASQAAASRFVLLNDDNPAIAYAGNWGHSTNRSFGDYAADVHYTQREGDSFSYTFTGTGIEVLTEKDESQGSMDFYLDDAFVETADTSGTGTREAQQTVFQVANLPIGEHTLKAVKRTINDGDYMLLDALKVRAETLVAPDRAEFDHANPADLAFELPFGGSSLTGITNGAASLVKGTDYEVNGGTATLRQSYLAKQPAGALALAFAFAGGDTQYVAINVSGAAEANSEIAPKTASFDLKPSAQADVQTTLTLNGNALAGISNKGSALAEGDDYTMAYNVVTIHQSYLARQSAGTTTLTFAFSAGATQTLTIAVKAAEPEGVRYQYVNNDDPAILYTGSWSRNSGRGIGDYKDDVHFTEKSGDWFQYAFRGTGVKLVTERDESQGEMDIYIDGELKATVDTYHDGRQSLQTVYEIQGLTDGQHTIKAVKKSGTFMLLDMLQISIPSLIDPAAAEFDKAEQDDIQVNLLDDAGKLSSISNEAAELDPGADYTVEGRTVLIHKAYLASLPLGSVKLNFAFEGDYLEDIHATAENGDSFTYSFKGRGAALYMPRGPEQGEADIYVDGELKETINAHGESRESRQKVFAVSGLSVGLHTLKAVKKSGALMLVDQIVFDVGASATGPGPTNPPVVIPRAGSGAETVYGYVRAANAANDGATKVPVTRTAQAGGLKQDDVVLTGELAGIAAKVAAEAGADTVVLVIPDGKREIGRTTITIERDAVRRFADGKLSLGIEASGVVLTIPNTSIEGFGEDLTFTFDPVTDAAALAKLRTSAEAAISGASVTVAKLAGTALSIKTNLGGREAKVAVPLGDLDLPAMGAIIGLYLEGADGKPAFITGSIVDDQGKRSLQASTTSFGVLAAVVAERASIESHEAYMIGVDRSSFQPNRSLTRAEMAAILSRLAPTSSKDASIAFSDVDAKHWAANAVRDAASAGLMRGFADGTFRPDQPITRAEMAAVAVKLTKGEAAPGEGFADTRGNWAEDAIRQAQRAGIVKGYADGTFRPDQSLSRAEAVVILNRALNRGPLRGLGALPWKDVPADHWAAADIAEATVDHGFTTDASVGEVIVP